MLSRQFCSPSSRRNGERAPLTTSRRQDSNLSDRTTKTSNSSRSLASRAGALVRQLSTKSTSSFASEQLPSSNKNLHLNTKTSKKNATLAKLHTATASQHTENGERSLALQFYNRALILQRLVFGQDSRHAATTLNNIGICLMNLGDGHFFAKCDEAAGKDATKARREYIQFAECAFREALWIREQEFGVDSEEVQDVETNLELLLGEDWDHDDDNCIAIDTCCAKKKSSSSENDTASSSSSGSISSSSSSSVDKDEEVEFDYRGSSFVDVDLTPGSRSTPPAISTTTSSASGLSTSSGHFSASSSGHSTCSFGEVGLFDDDEYDEVEDEPQGRPSPSIACSILFADKI